jgi:hypothetical protein
MQMAGKARRPEGTQTERQAGAKSDAVFEDCLTLPFAIDEEASFQGEDGGAFRISGWMNTFRVTSSGRMLDPRDFERWLQSHAGETPTLPMLINHGFTVEGIATIGLWDAFEFDPNRGMRWSGFVAEGTPLAEQTRVLLRQKALRQLSVRVNPSAKRRTVTADERDLPDNIRNAIEASGLEGVLLFQEWFPMEGSVVDVADDVGARIAASVRPEGDVLSELRALSERLDRALSSGALSAAEGQAVLDKVASQIEAKLRGFWEEGKERFYLLMESFAADRDAEYADLLIGERADEPDGCCGHGQDGTPRAMSAGGGQDARPTLGRQDTSPTKIDWNKLNEHLK